LIRRRATPARRVELAEWILYVCALIADQPRAIDRYIDYFGLRSVAEARFGKTASARE